MYSLQSACQTHNSHQRCGSIQDINQLRTSDKNNNPIISNPLKRLFSESNELPSKKRKFELVNKNEKSEFEPNFFNALEEFINNPFSDLLMSEAVASPSVSVDPPSNEQKQIHSDENLSESFQDRLILDDFWAEELFCSEGSIFETAEDENFAIEEFYHLPFDPFYEKNSKTEDIEHHLILVQDDKKFPGDLDYLRTIKMRGVVQFAEVKELFKDHDSDKVNKKFRKFIVSRHIISNGTKVGRKYQYVVCEKKFEELSKGEIPIPLRQKLPADHDILRQIQDNKAITLKWFVAYFSDYKYNSVYKRFQDLVGQKKLLPCDGCSRRGQTYCVSKLALEQLA